MFDAVVLEGGARLRLFAPQDGRLGRRKDWHGLVQVMV